MMCHIVFRIGPACNLVGGWVDYFEEGRHKLFLHICNYFPSTWHRRSGISTVGGANRLFAGLSGVRIAVAVIYFCIIQGSRPGLGAHPASYTMGTGVFFLG
jgi:hypothetical protein